MNLNEYYHKHNDIFYIRNLIELFYNPRFYSWLIMTQAIF